MSDRQLEQGGAAIAAPAAVAVGRAHHSLDFVFIGTLLQSLLELVLGRCISRIVLVHLLPAVSSITPIRGYMPRTRLYAFSRKVAMAAGWINQSFYSAHSVESPRSNGCGFGGGLQPSLPWRPRISGMRLRYVYRGRGLSTDSVLRLYSWTYSLADSMNEQDCPERKEKGVTVARAALRWAVVTVQVSLREMVHLRQDLNSLSRGLPPKIVRSPRPRTSTPTRPQPP